MYVHVEIVHIDFTAVCQVVAWPSGLRRWFKAPVISMAWVRIPPLPVFFFIVLLQDTCTGFELIFHLLHVYMLFCL